MISCSGLARGGLIVAALVFLQQSLSLGLWMDGMPGPGLLPLLAAVALLGLMVPVLAGRDGGGVFDVGADEAPADPSDGDGGIVPPGRPLEALAWLAAFALSLKTVGFVVASVALFGLWIVRMHGRRWPVAFAVAVVLVCLGTVVFHTLLGVPMPLGPSLD